MFAFWGRAVVRGRWWILAATLALVVVGGAWGTGVFGALSGGGFDDPASPSRQAADRITQTFGRQSADVLALYTSSGATVDDPAMREPVQAALAQLSRRPEVVQVRSYYTTGSPALVSSDRRATYAAIQLRDGDEDHKRADLDAIRPLLTADSATVSTEVGGLVAFIRDANTQIEQDVVKAEVLSLPILLILMIFIFRGLIAAATPLLVGVVAILGAFSVTRILANFTDISVFAANVITMLGLGMAIDYALFVVNRFREELSAGHDTGTAIARTIATAGRTVMVSGLTVALALSSLLLFPMGFLKSMGYGGMAAVLVAMLAALTALPALLAVLGPRINALRIPLPGRRRPADQAVVRDGGWARLARSVMRRPVLYLIGVSVVLVAIAAPFLRASFGGFDERVLPEGTPSRTVAQRIQQEFPGGSTSPILALVDGASPEAAQAYADRVRTLPGVTGVALTANRGDSSLLAITYRGEPSSAEARDVVVEVRDQAPPAGAAVLVAGRPAADLDQLDSLGSRLGLMAVYVAVVTFILLFFAFGSVVLPIKAIVMNIVSIGASFGVVVWVFQDGHLSDWLGFTSTGFLEPTNLILMLAILFGLSTDYEVFLLSRVREEWDRTGDNVEAVTAGLQRTGGIITAAALLLIVVIGGFATGGAATIKMLGIGTLVAVAVDAALVRTLLVPATMRLLGRWNWWAPGPLAKIYRRYGLRESDQPEHTRQAQPVAR
ncbi:MAG TPA: MMPL family transporter [Micromonosporaceae bacterium]